MSGHIHTAARKEIEGVTYLNCGDWVDSCTALIENTDGRIELIHWGSVTAQSAVPNSLSPRAKEAA